MTTEANNNVQPASLPPPGSLPPPATAIEARTRLNERIVNQEWSAKFLQQDVATVREFHELSAIAADGDKIKAAMDGVVPAFVLGGIPDSEQVNLTNLANHLRDAGISDGAIEQALRNGPVAQKEIDAVTRWKESAMKNPEFTKKYLANDPEAYKQMTLANIVLSGKVESL
jgi:hypothetical protein